VAKDAEGNLVPALSITAVSSDATVIASSTVTASTTKQNTVAGATACAAVTADCLGLGSYTADAAGASTAASGKTATITYRTLLSGTTFITATPVTVTIGGAIATETVAFDKATYAPGERARIYVTPLDSTGKEIAFATFSNLLATGGISTASALTYAGSTTTADSLTAVSITTKANSSSTSGAKAGSMEYTVYMPVSGGTVTISATGGSSLPVAGRVAVSATATVTDSGSAALAAVTALATTVASLKTLITTLTNLVLKIQKKVKA
jgi:hypothetical protein